MFVKKPRKGFFEGMAKNLSPLVELRLVSQSMFSSHTQQKKIKQTLAFKSIFIPSTSNSIYLENHISF